MELTFGIRLLRGQHGRCEILVGWGDPIRPGRVMVGLKDVANTAAAGAHARLLISQILLTSSRFFFFYFSAL